MYKKPSIFNQINQLNWTEGCLDGENKLNPALDEGVT